MSNGDSGISVWTIAKGVLLAIAIVWVAAFLLAFCAALVSGAG